MSTASFILAGLFFLSVNIPCAAMIWIGTRFFDQLGRHPSKTPGIQLSIVWKLVVIEVVSFTLLMALFKLLQPGDAA